MATRHIKRARYDERHSFPKHPCNVLYRLQVQLKYCSIPYAVFLETTCRRCYITQHYSNAAFFRLCACVEGASLHSFPRLRWFLSVVDADAPPPRPTPQYMALRYSTVQYTSVVKPLHKPPVQPPSCQTGILYIQHLTPRYYMHSALLRHELERKIQLKTDAVNEIALLLSTAAKNLNLLKS